MTYKCLKCNNESDWIGLCPKCYMETYRFTKDDIELIKTRKIKANSNHLRLAKNDNSGGVVAMTLEDTGVKNPIIINENRNILLGHHRFNHILKKNIEYTPVVIKKTKHYSLFTEGSSEWLYVGFLNDFLVLNVCRMRDIMHIFERIAKTHDNNEELCPDYLKIEIEIFHIKEMADDL